MLTVSTNTGYWTPFELLGLFDENEAQACLKGSNWSKDDKDNYILALSVPGLNKDNTEFFLQDRALVVKGKAETIVGTLEYNNRYCVPKDGDLDRIDVSIQDGIAFIVIPKATDLGGKKLQIK